MKLLITLAIVLVSLNLVQCGHLTSLIKTMSGKCKKQENASDADVDKVSKGENLDTAESKCFAACLAEQMGFMKDNKLGKNTEKKFGKLTGKDEEKKKKAQEIATACAEVTHEDKCEAASAILQCIKKESESRGLKLF